MLWIKCRQGLMFAIPMICLSVTGLTGCDQKEKVIEIQTPAGEIQFERSKSSGKIDVDINADSRKP